MSPISKDVILAIDVSSLTVKVAAVTDAGEVLASASLPYEIRTDDDAGFAKSFDVQEVWGNIVRCTKDVFEKAGKEVTHVVAISSCAQRIACVFVDEAGEVIYAGPNKDARGVDSQFCIEAIFPDEVDLFKITGRGPSLVFALARYFWFREERDEDFAKIKKILMLDDWIVFKLTGNYCTDPTTASDSQFFDVAKREWAPEIVDGFHFNPELFPEIVNPGTVIGNVTQSAADELGIPPAVPVVKGGADTQITILGAGCIAPRQIGISLGSTATANLVLSEGRTDPEQNFWTNCYVLPDTWVIEANAGFTGGLYNWFKRSFLAGVEDNLNALAEKYIAELPPGSNATFAFLGPERMNFKNQTEIKRSAFVFPSQGTISTIEINRAACMKALFENIAFGVLQNYQALLGFSSEIDKVVCCGGMAKSAGFVQMLSNVFGRDIYVPAVKDSSIIGLAMCALVGLQRYSSFSEAVAVIVKQEVFHPQEKIVQQYADVYRQWGEYKKKIDQL